MVSHHHSAPARSSGTDVAAWALVAVIVALVCAAAGWAFARQDAPSYRDLARDTELAAREGLMRGEATGYAQGARLGRREAAMQRKTAVQLERQQAARAGYDAGWYEGRVRAGDPNAVMGSTLGSSGAYPAAGYEDVLASSLLATDAPGYSTSAYDSLGYGVGATTPYLGTSATERYARGW